MKVHEWQSRDGKKVERMLFSNVEDGRCPFVEASQEEGTLVCCVEYLGDRTDVWIVRMLLGIEMARYNARLAETIVWDNS